MAVKHEYNHDSPNAIDASLEVELRFVVLINICVTRSWEFRTQVPRLAFARG